MCHFFKKSTLSRKSSVVIDEDERKDLPRKKSSEKNKPIIGILRKESLEQHNMKYETVLRRVSMFDELTAKASTTPEETVAARNEPEPETTRTTTTRSSSDKYTYISDDVRPLIAQAPNWFGEVLKREFIPPGPPKPSSRSYSRLSQSNGISCRLRRQLQSKAVICKRGMTPAETKHNTMIATY